MTTFCFSCSVGQWENRGKQQGDSLSACWSRRLKTTAEKGTRWFLLDFHRNATMRLVSSLVSHVGDQMQPQTFQLFCGRSRNIPMSLDCNTGTNSSW